MKHILLGTLLIIMGMLTPGAHAEEEVSLAPLVSHWEVQDGHLAWRDLEPPTTNEALVREYWRVKKGIAKYVRGLRIDDVFFIWNSTRGSRSYRLHLMPDDMEHERMTCESELPLAPSAKKMLDLLGCVWGNV